MKKVLCGVCGREWERHSCEIITLTEAERLELERQGVKPLDEYIYCGPCWRTLSDPTAGPNYGKGLIQQNLQRIGVGNAEAIATKFQAKLVARIQKPKPS